MPAKREDVTIPTTPSSHDVAVVGGGVIGLAVAWRARARGPARACVLERGELGAGDLARRRRDARAGQPRPTRGERALLAPRPARARGAGRAFAARARRTSAASTSATARAARSSSRATATRPRRSSASARCASASACASSALLPSAARALEPALAPTLRARARRARRPRRRSRAWSCAALARAARARRRRAAHAASRSTRRSRALPAPSSVVRRRRAVVGRASATSARVRPVKGQSLRLRDPGGPGLLERVVRWERAGYLVPRGDGRYVLGATMEERGFDTAVTARRRPRAAARRRRARARRARARGRGARRRPAPGHARQRADPRPPRARPAARAGRPGHYRNGILLAPLTADLVAAELAGEADRARRSRPGRFAGGWPSRDRPSTASRASATARRSPSCSPTSASRRAPAASPSPSTARSSRAPSGPSRRVDDGRPRRGADRDAGRLTDEHRADPDHRHAVRRSPGARCARA